MDRLIYTAMSGMTDSMVRQRVIAANMANAQTAGFKSELIWSTPVTVKDGGQALEVRALTDGEVHGADMKPGTISSTGRALDVAVLGNSLLAVQASDGSEAYTRRGDLNVDATGVLVNGDGLPVLGQGGPITVPQGQTLTIGPDGQVLAADPANPAQAPQVLDKLKLVSPQGAQVAKNTDGLFAVVGGGTLPVDADAKLAPASLEGSNVDPAEVMVTMVQAQRLFDMRTKMVSTAREVDESGSQLMKLPGGG